MRFSPIAASLGTLLFVGAAWAQPLPLTLTWSTGEENPPEALVALDADDDNDDGVPDLAEAPSPDAARADGRTTS